MADQTKLEQKIEDAVTTAVADPTVPATPAAVPAIVDALTKLVPEIMHSTNSEPFYLSRIFWGQMLALIGVVLGIFGYSFPAEMQGQLLGLIVTVGPIVAGVAFTLYGRFFAKKPLGS